MENKKNEVKEKKGFNIKNMNGFIWAGLVAAGVGTLAYINGRHKGFEIGRKYAAFEIENKVMFEQLDKAFAEWNKKISQ